MKSLVRSFIAFILLCVTLGNISIIMHAQGDNLAHGYNSLGFYDVKVSFSKAPPRLVLKFSVPLSRYAFRDNASDIHVEARWVVGREHVTRLGLDALKIEYSYAEFYRYTSPSSYPSWVLHLTMNESGAFLESKVFMYGSGKVLKYVKIAATPDRDLYEKLAGAPVTYTVRAVFYGSDYEGLSLDYVEKNIKHVLEAELSLVIPFYTARPELVGKWFSNRTVQDVSVEYRDGKFYASFKVVDRNTVLPVVIYRSIALKDICRPTAGVEYVCQRSYREEGKQLVGYLTLKNVLDRIYEEWEKTALKTYGEDEWRENVEPLEKELENYIYLLYLYPDIYPQDPFLWLAVTDSALYDVADVSIVANLSLDKAPEAEPVPSYEGLKSFLSETVYAPVTVVFDLKDVRDVRNVMELSALILMEIELGFRIYDMPAIKQYFAGLLDAPRKYATTPYVNLVVSPADLYNATVVIPFWVYNLRYVCESAENYTKVAWRGDRCVIYGITLGDIGSQIYAALHPELLTPTETETSPMQSTATTASPPATWLTETPPSTPPTASTTLPSAPASQPYTVAGSPRTSTLPLSDVVMYTLFALIIAFVAISIKHVVRK